MNPISLEEYVRNMERALKKTLERNFDRAISLYNEIEYRIQEFRSKQARKSEEMREKIAKLGLGYITKYVSEDDIKAEILDFYGPEYDNDFERMKREIGEEELRRDMVEFGAHILVSRAMSGIIKVPELEEDLKEYKRISAKLESLSKLLRKVFGCTSATPLDPETEVHIIYTTIKRLFFGVDDIRKELDEILKR